MKTYIHYGHTSFDKDLFVKIINEEPMSKPRGGLWASDIKTKYGWKDWNKSEHFAKCNKENSFTFTLSDNANVLYINSVKDLESLPKIKSKFGLTSWIVLDFEKLAEIYDAIEVNISSDYDLYYKLYGWDCDSILIMNPDVVVSDDKYDKDTFLSELEGSLKEMQEKESKRKRLNGKVFGE